MTFGTHFNDDKMNYGHTTCAFSFCLKSHHFNDGRGPLFF